MHFIYLVVEPDEVEAEQAFVELREFLWVYFRAAQEVLRNRCKRLGLSLGVA